MACYSCGAEGGDEVRLCPTCTKERIAIRNGYTQSPKSGASQSASFGSGNPESEAVNFGNLKTILLVAIIFVLVAGLGVYLILNKGSTSEALPVVANLEAPIKNFLLNERSTCKGEKSLTSFEILRIGQFVPEFGGFPVYANYALLCKEGNNSTTFQDLDRNTNAAVAYVKKTALRGYQVFTPEIFKKFETEMNQQMKAEFDKLSKKLDNAVVK